MCSEMLFCIAWMYRGISELLLPSYQLDAAEPSPLTSGIKKPFSPKELLFTGYFLLLRSFSVNPTEVMWKNSVDQQFHTQSHLNHSSFSYWCLFCSSAGCLEHVCIPRGTEFLLHDTESGFHSFFPVLEWVFGALCSLWEQNQICVVNIWDC